VVGANLRPGHAAGPGHAPPRPWLVGHIGRCAVRSRLRQSLPAYGGAPVPRLGPRAEPLSRLPVSRRAPFVRTSSPLPGRAERLCHGRCVPSLGPIQDGPSDLLPIPAARLSLASTRSTTCGRSWSETSRQHRCRAAELKYLVLAGTPWATDCHPTCCAARTRPMVPWGRGAGGACRSPDMLTLESGGVPDLDTTSGTGRTGSTPRGRRTRKPPSVPAWGLCRAGRGGPLPG
jgi:hypothetical protein